MCLCGVCGCIVYHALFLEELTVLELMEKIAALFSMPFRQLRHIYKQGPTSIHVLVTDEVRASGAQCSKGRRGEYSKKVYLSQHIDTVVKLLVKLHVVRLLYVRFIFFVGPPTIYN